MNGVATKFDVEASVRADLHRDGLNSRRVRRPGGLERIEGSQETGPVHPDIEHPLSGFCCGRFRKVEPELVFAGRQLEPVTADGIALETVNLRGRIGGQSSAHRLPFRNLPAKRSPHPPFDKRAVRPPDMPVAIRPRPARLVHRSSCINPDLQRFSGLEAVRRGHPFLLGLDRDRNVLRQQPDVKTRPSGLPGFVGGNIPGIGRDGCGCH